MVVLIEGHKTARSRKRPSVPVRWLAQRHLLVGRLLDFGCGRGTDADAFDMARYDPFWSPQKPEGVYDTIVCVYVLNVVSEASQKEALNDIRALLADGGRAYVVVRRDLPREGRKGRGVRQRFVVLDAPLVRETARYAVYEVR